MSLARVKLAYKQAALMVGTPYLFGGDHGIVNFRTEWEKGVDCASGASVILSAGGMLARPRAPYALTTEEFETWGEKGRGEYMALYVFDGLLAKTVRGALQQDQVHHCALWFNPDYFEHEWWQASNPTDGVGFIDFDPTGFHVRHWAD